MVSICGGTISVTYVLDIIELVIRIVNESVFLVDLTCPPASSDLSYLFFFTLVNHSDTHLLCVVLPCEDTDSYPLLCREPSITR